MEEKRDNKRIISIVVTCMMLAVILAYMIISPKPTGDELKDGMIKTIVTRGAGSCVFFTLICYLGYDNILKPCKKGIKRKYLPVLPFLLVVINNFPIIGLITKNAQLTNTDALTVTLFIFENIMIALFEETAFRGTLYMYVLENRRASVKQIFRVTVFTSLIFGCVHLFNIFEGGAPGGTVLQVGYSFLIGGMCALTLLLTKNLWICIILHALFDIGGKLISSLGNGKIWDALTVTITAVLGIMTLAHALMIMKKTVPDEAGELYKK